VALDHCDRLGDTVELIAADKVHIARPGRPFLTAETQPGVLEVFREYCERIGAHLIQVDVSSAKHYQEANAILARAVAGEFVRSLGQDWKLAEEVTLRPPVVPGRSEIIGHYPTLLVDGANNPDGAHTFACHLTDTLKVPREKVVLVLGILADKDWAEMARTLVPLARQVVVTQSTSPRALPVEELATFVRGLGVEPIVVTDVPGAVARAKELAGAEDWVVATGSFTTIAEVPRG
jgi:dihydrofolate synthase/folylpolyglutamate synthase